MISGWRWIHEELTLSLLTFDHVGNLNVSISVEPSIFQVSMGMRVEKNKNKELLMLSRNFPKIKELSSTAIHTIVCSQRRWDLCSQKRVSKLKNSISDGMNGEMNGISGMEREPQILSIFPST